jgi:hypothetical protein
MARRIVRDADRVLRDEYKLDGWVSKVEERRRNYFGWCERTLEQLSQVAGGEPSDESVVIAIMAALREDDSFSAHIAKKGGAFLVETDN